MGLKMPDLSLEECGVFFPRGDNWRLTGSEKVTIELNHVPPFCECDTFLTGALRFSNCSFGILTIAASASVGTGEPLCSNGGELECVGLGMVILLLGAAVLLLCVPTPRSPIMLSSRLIRRWPPMEDMRGLVGSIAGSREVCGFTLAHGVFSFPLARLGFDSSSRRSLSTIRFEIFPGMNDGLGLNGSDPSEVAPTHEHATPRNSYLWSGSHRSQS